MASLRDVWNRLFGRHQHEEVTADVRKAATELRTTAVVVRQRLDNYLNADDPFVAMMADVYERRQEAMIYKSALDNWRVPPA